MSQVLIQQYLNQLQDLKKVSGTHRESVVREAFKDLLKGWARSRDLIFVPEYEIATPAKDRRYVDGALVHQLRVPFGYWEAKDEKDDLDAEIDYKLRRGYPQDNIIFEDSTRAVLVQEKGRSTVAPSMKSKTWRSYSISSSTTSAPRSPSSAKRSSSSRTTCRWCWKRFVR